MNCKKCEKLAVGAAYGDLDPRSAKLFEAHVRECAACRAQYEQLQSSLALLSRRERPDPGPEYWDGFWAALAPKLQAEPKKQPSRARSGWLQRIPMPAWALAGALSIFVIGIFVGRMGMDVPVTTPEVVPDRARLTPVELQARSHRYLERSKVLLLGVVNFEPTDEDPTSLDLPYNREISKELIREAAVLQNELSTANHQRLHQLVEDLQLILLQIANLEESADSPAIDVIKSTVDDKGILLKINLEAMRASGDDGQQSPGAFRTDQSDRKREL